jgi:GNAT superfamily N-acetyltransferase
MAMDSSTAPLAAAAAELRDGTRLALHAVGPEDRACIAAGFERLSARSRQSRFLRPMPRLDGATLDYLAAVDGYGHLAVAAATEAEEPVGLARCVRLADEPETAEIAVTVLDDWQGRGVARVLATELARRAALVGIRRFRALFGWDNRPVARLLAAAGIAIAQDGAGMAKADIDLALILRGAGPASA